MKTNTLGLGFFFVVFSCTNAKICTVSKIKEQKRNTHFFVTKYLYKNFKFTPSELPKSFLKKDQLCAVHKTISHQ